MGLSAGARVSPFPSRVRSRGVLPPLGLQSVFREVRTEDELRQALTPLDTGTTAATLANTGRRIVIAGPITLTSPVIIPATMPGVTIESHGHIPIYCGVDGIDAFDVRAPLCTLRGLLISGAGTNSWNRAVVLDSSAASCAIVHNYIVADQLVDDEGAGGAVECVIGWNTFLPGGAAPSIACDSPKWRITGNTMTRTAGGVAINVGANAGRVAIIGNECDGVGITTSASLGFNTVSSNTLAGTLTTLGTDAVGLNT